MKNYSLSVLHRKAFWPTSIKRRAKDSISQNLSLIVSVDAGAFHKSNESISIIDGAPLSKCLHFTRISRSYINVFSINGYNFDGDLF